MLITYVAAALIGGLATLGQAWGAFGLGALLLTPFGASAAALAVALPVYLVRSRSMAGDDLSELTDGLVAALRRTRAKASEPPPVRDGRRRRVG